MTARRPPSSARASRPAARGGASGRTASSRSASRPTTSQRRSATASGRGAAARPAAPRPQAAAPKVTANGSVPASARGTGARAILNRPGGPARGDRRRAHNGLVLPEVLTVRLLVLAVVVLIATVLLVPTVRAAVQQSMELHQLRSQLEARSAEADRLQRELDRWDDDAYVEGRARTDLLFVMPGDKVWRTIGGEKVVEDVDPATGKKVDAGVVGGNHVAGTPWYATLWESVRVADGPSEHDADEPEGAAPLDRPDDTGPEVGGAVGDPSETIGE